MAGFHYKAIDNETGSLEEGVLNADNETDARRRVRKELGYLPVEVKLLSDETSASPDSRLFTGKVSNWQLSLMTRQFASLLSASVPIEKILNTLIDQANEKRMRRALGGVRGKITEGNGLAQSMRAFPFAFPDLYCSMISAGESSGKLDTVMLRLADYLEQREELRRKTGLALMYPMILGGVAFCVIVGLMVYVVPQVVQVFERNHQELPLLTVALIGISEFIEAYGHWLALDALGALAVFQMFWRNEAMRERIQLIILRLPIAGALVRDINSERFTSTLSILLGSGVPLLTSLEACKGTLSNIPMKKSLGSITDAVREGGSLSRALEGDRMFPPIVAGFIANGEETGRLSEMLDKAADLQARELQHKALRLTGLVEPALILVMGGIVLLITLSVLLPILELNRIS